MVESTNVLKLVLLYICCCFQLTHTITDLVFLAKASTTSYDKVKNKP